MAPRGLKRALQTTAATRLGGSGKHKCFRRIGTDGTDGERLQGLTKALNKKIYSKGKLPEIARRAAAPRPGGHWRGPNAGRKRGARVDAQVSRVINNGPSSAKHVHVYGLTKTCFAAMTKLGLTPILAQRALSCNLSCRVGTAADIIAYDEALNKLVVVELKSGYDQGRDLPATRAGKECRLGAPLEGSKDTTRARHMAQLLATWAMLKREKKLFERLGELGVSAEVGAVLLYCNDEGAESVELCDWWFKRGPALLEALK